MLYNEVPVSQFDEGNAIRIFDRLCTDRGLVVLKNGQPIAVALSPEEYTRLVEAEEDYKLTVEANRRLEENGGKPTIPFGDILEKLKVGEDTLSKVSDPQLQEYVDLGMESDKLICVEKANLLLKKVLK